MASILNTPSDPLFAVKSKIGRAYEHTDLFDQERRAFFDDFREGDAYRIVPEIDPKTSEEVHRLRLTNSLPLVRWAISSAIVVHLLRSALDNLVETLTVKHTGHSLSGTEFPVFHDPADYARLNRKGTRKGQPDIRSGLHKVRGIDPAAANIIEKLQPYHRGKAYTEDVLWVLHEMWLADKHRVPPVAVSAVIARNTKFVSGLTRSVTGNIALEFVDGAEILRIAPASDPQTPYMKVDIEFAYAIAIEGITEQALRLPDILRVCGKYVSGVILDLERFAN